MLKRSAVVVGECANFAAYAFAPAILVTPLGALSVLIGAVLGSYFLNERLGTLGKLGCAICLVGSIIIVLHAPPDEEVETIDLLLKYAIKIPFLIYAAFVTIFAVVMIYRIAPVYGRRNPLIYLSVCSTVGSISVMAIKAFGIAVKLTFAGNNQFTHPSTYVFAIVVVVCILTQMNYFNKALSQFNTNIVNPLYYVTFTTFTLIASFILFRGFNTTSAINTLSLLSGFLVIFAGVYLLNLSREDPEGHRLLAAAHAGSSSASNAHHHHHKHSSSSSSPAAGKYTDDAIPTDPIAGLGTRRSMQARRSADSFGGLGGGHRLSSSSLGARESAALMGGYDLEAQPPFRNTSGGGGGGGSTRHSRSHSAASSLRGSREYVGLGDVPEDSDEEAHGSANKRTSFDDEEGEEVRSGGVGERKGVTTGVRTGVRTGRTF
ncbi:MAG: hypothetical protein M1821_010041 [Bathelium mastoideum]|nr:MAG: hypothetical protein M1821_010041 [Bathelium mastoideum]